MRWIPVTLTSGKATIVDFSKVMYATETDNGCTLHLQHEAMHASGKAIPLPLHIRQSLDTVTKSLARRRFF